MILLETLVTSSVLLLVGILFVKPSSTSRWFQFRRYFWLKFITTNYQVLIGSVRRDRVRLRLIFIIISRFHLELLLRLGFLKGCFLHICKNGVLLIVWVRIHKQLLSDLSTVMGLLKIRKLCAKHSHRSGRLMHSVFARGPFPQRNIRRLWKPHQLCVGDV